MAAIVLVGMVIRVGIDPNIIQPMSGERLILKFLKLGSLRKICGVKIRINLPILAYMSAV